MIFPRHRTRKPNVGAQLDWRNPLTRGLRYALAFNEGGGGSAANAAVRNLALPITATTLPTDALLGSTTDMTWTPRRGGALNFSGTTASYVDLGANDDTTGEITWLAWIFPTELSRGLYTVFGQNRSDGTESLDSVYLTSGGNLSWWVYNTGGGATEELNGTASSVAANGLYRLAGRRAGATGAWAYDQWVNERLNDTASGVTRNPSVSGADGNFRVGNAGLFTAGWFTGDYILFMLWNGVALKDHDILSLSANPWQLWQHSPRRLWVGTAGTPPPPGAACVAPQGDAPILAVWNQLGIF